MFIEVRQMCATGNARGASKINSAATQERLVVVLYAAGNMRKYAPKKSGFAACPPDEWLERNVRRNLRE
jgi:hypothetical protein